VRVLNRKIVLAEGNLVPLRSHTLATELMMAGQFLEMVARVVGHTSTKVTEKSYSHWACGRQEKLEEAMKNSWAHLGTN
jgi:site-specific recombinase XerD